MEEVFEEFEDEVKEVVSSTERCQFLFGEKKLVELHPPPGEEGVEVEEVWEGEEVWSAVI